MATKDAKAVDTAKLANEAVDQETGEVFKGQPGGTEGQAVSDRPAMTEAEAREINGYADYKNVAEAVDAKMAEKGYDKDKETSTGAKYF